MKQGDPCPKCATVARDGVGGVGGVTIVETPKGPVQGTCINCRTEVTIEETTWPDATR